MNGQMMNYSKYLEPLKNTPHFDSTPMVKLNIRGLLKYSKEQGKKPSELTDEEKNMFVG